VTKICLITCYKQPDYIRAKTLRLALSNIDSVDLIILKNRHTGFLRYPEVLWKLIVARFTKKPDLYYLTFRGYEMLPFVRLVTLGKPFIFDEFINFIEWVIYEHHKIKENSLIAKLLHSFYRFWLNSANLITTDTVSHANYSSKLMNIPLDKYIPLTVSTDEQTFKTIEKNKIDKNDTFNVFYYGSMLPLHGVEIVIEAMKLLKNYKIELTLIGGKQNIGLLVKKAKLDGANIKYKTWVSFDKLPVYMNQADICLGGPFGGTVQSQFVITGKTYQFLQMSKPVIIGKNQESDLFTNEKDSLIIEQSNPQALAAAILWAFHNSIDLLKIGKNGRELYQKYFSNQQLTKQLTVMLSNKHIL